MPERLKVTVLPSGSVAEAVPMLMPVKLSSAKLVAEVLVVKMAGSSISITLKLIAKTVSFTPSLAVSVRS